MPMSSSLNVLVVDDSRTNRQLMQAMLSKMGHHVTLAENGIEALAICEQSRPDMVLMDVSMPVMNGFEAVHEMRQRYADWFPIVFLSAQTSNQEIVEGLRVGGDDYLFKPVNREIMQAKINMFQTRIRQSQRLRDYHERMMEESDTARDFIKQFTALDKIQDEQVKFFLKPAENFSGDLIAVARRPDNTLHVLLADSAGHGLTSALAVIPITQPFYQMTAKGFEIPAIVRELNRRVREYLPLPRFVAAVILSLDPETGIMQVWNGGCPPAILIDSDGVNIVHRFKSRHLPLGVVAPADFDTLLEYYTLEGEPGHVLMCSDGATEIRVEESLHLGHEGLLSGAKHSTKNHLFDRMVEVVKEKLGGLPPSDDIAMIMVDCLPFETKTYDEPDSSQESSDIELCNYSQSGVSVWEFSLTLTAQQIKRLDVVPFLLGITGQIEGGRADGKLFLVLSELFNNALDHGVLKLDSALKNQPDGLELYFSERATRLEELERGQISIRLEKINCRHCSCLKIFIKDSGDGFDYSEKVSDIRKNRLFHGRGISLLGSVCRGLHYSGNGSEVTAIMQISSNLQ